MANRLIVELVDAVQLSPSVKALDWRSVDRQPLDFIAGQWFNFDVETATGVVRRAYSIASAPDPDRPDRLVIAVTRVEAGGASSALHGLPLGARLAIDGPHGFFTREQAQHLPALFVGTGTGIAPLRAMIEQELRSADGPALRLLFGCRTEHDRLFHEDLVRWAAACPRFSFEVTLSRGAAQWSGRRGYVQHHLSSLLGSDDRPHIYVCGLSKMIGEVRKVAKEQLGYDRRLIHSERYD